MVSSLIFMFFSVLHAIIVGSHLPAVMAISSSTSTVIAQCTNQANVCLADEVCQGCMPDIAVLAADTWTQDDFSECETGFLGSSSDTSICEAAGAMFCCSNEGDCVANESFSEYWTCIFDTTLCSMADVTCMGGLGGSYRSDDDSFVPDDDGVTVEESGSSHASRRWLGPRNQPSVLFAVLLVGIAVAARPYYYTISV